MRPVLLATLDYPPARGGVASYLENLAGCFPTEATVILAPEMGDTHADDVKSPMQIYRRRLIARVVRPRWLPALRWTDWLVKKEQPRHLIVSHLLPMGEVARFMRRRHGLPYTVIVHGFDVALALTGSRLKRERARQVLYEAETVVANSLHTSLLVQALGVPREKTLIVRPSPHFPLTTRPDAAAATAWRQERGWEDGFLLVSVSRLVARKGTSDLIRAVAALGAEDRIRLVIVSDGPERSALTALAAELGVTDRVHFLGDVPYDEVGAVLNASDAFAMVPRSLGADVEGFGIVYLEAGLFGKPVIGARSGGVPDAVLHGETGLLVDPGDLAALVGAIRRLRNEPELARRLGERGRRRILEEFGWSRQARPLVRKIFPEIEM
jgi:phosphatidylinositol alpha-1,6-mannosyltransferase